MKEHPVVLGTRAPSFYEGLFNLENVYFAPIETNSLECLAKADAVYIHTGSTGFGGGAARDACCRSI